jgi:hypothetical protein
MSVEHSDILRMIGDAGIGCLPVATLGGAGPSPLAEDVPIAAAALALLALAIAVAAMVVAFRSLAQAKRLRSSREDAGSGAAIGGRTADLEEVMRDAEELSQRIAAELDARAAALERLLARADRIGAMAERELDLGSRTPGPGDGTEPLPDAHRRIYELADEGLSPVEIARRLSQTAGQVELTLSLRRLHRGSKPA